MVKKYRIILLVCCVALICNVFAKIYFLDKQSQRIALLQKVVAAARSGSYLEKKKSEPHRPNRENMIRIFGLIPEEFMFTEYAARIRSLIDRNSLTTEENLVFRPEKSDRKDILTYSTRINVSGSYAKVKHLISDIQNMPGLAYIEGPSMVRMKGAAGRIRLDLKLLVFFKKDGQGGAA